MLVIGTLTFSGAPAAIAEDETEPPAPSVEMFVSTGAGADVAPGGPVVSAVTIANGTDTELSAGTASIELNRTPLANGTALNAWLDGGAIPGTFQSVASEPTPIVGAGSEQAVSVIADADALADLTPGVYAIKARLTGARTADNQEHNLTAPSVMVVSDTQRSTAVLVPITATPSSGALLSADELANLTGEGGMLAGQLDAVTGTTAILGVDPAIPAAIRMLGSSAPPSAVTWLTRLESLPNEIFTLQFADADAAVQAHAKLPALLGTPDLTPLLQATNFPTPTATPTPTPGNTATPEPEPELPTNEALVSIAGANSTVLWPHPDVNDADLDAFASYLGDGVSTVLPASAVSGTPLAHSTADGHDLIITDDATSARLSAAVGLTDTAAVNHELAAAAGHLFFATQQSPTVVVALERSETRSPTALRDALTAFASPSTTLAALRAGFAASVTLNDSPSESRVPALQTMRDGEKKLTAFSSILTEPALLLVPDRIRLLRAIAVGVDDADFALLTAAYTERVQTTLDSVGIQRPKPVQLFTSAAPLPVWVRNDLPWEVNLQLYGSPSNRRLDMQQVTPVTALASGVQRVDVPLEALVASGEVDVTFTLRSNSGVLIGTPEVANVTLRADWEGIGLGILGAIIVILLGLGIIRTVRRKRAGGGDEATSENAGVDAGTDAADAASVKQETASEENDG